MGPDTRNPRRSGEIGFLNRSVTFSSGATTTEHATTPYRGASPRAGSRIEDALVSRNNVAALAHSTPRAASTRQPHNAFPCHR